MFDLAANVSEGNTDAPQLPGNNTQVLLGIRNTTTVFNGPQRDRVRIPRHIPYGGILSVRRLHIALDLL